MRGNEVLPCSLAPNEWFVWGGPPGGCWRVDLRLAGRSAVGGSGCNYSAYSVGSNENIAISTKRDDQDSNPSSASLDTTHLEV
jgi:hypothetical protein